MKFMAKIATLTQTWQQMPRVHRRLLLLLAFALLVTSLWPTQHPLLQENGSIALPLNLTTSTSDQLAAHVLSEEDLYNADNYLLSHYQTHHYDIANGDTLSGIFGQLSIGQSQLQGILAADLEVLALDIIRPGNQLIFKLDGDGNLQEMELYIHAGERIVYKRSTDDTFYYDEIIVPGFWLTEVIAGEIQGSFYQSAQRTGLTANERQQVNDIFREQLDFARQIQAGNRFEIVRSRQIVDGEFTGQSRIEAIRIHRNRVSNTAYLFEDGNYYDAKGDSLTRAFLRQPFVGNYRLSSHFNANRLHPVTGVRAPHNGTDWAMAPGTPLLAAGDGVVSRVENHAFAGLYVEIEHSAQYRTRYLHMSRIQVRRGQRVSRGERIGLSGATGRVTGPHLHYEFHINGRPVNPVTANIPMATTLPREQRAAFNVRVNELDAVIEQRLAQASRATTSN